MDAEYLSGLFLGLTKLPKAKERKGCRVGIRHVQLLWMCVAAVCVGALRAGVAGGGALLLVHGGEVSGNSSGNWQAPGFDCVAHGLLLGSYTLGYALALLPLSALLPRVALYRPTALLTVILAGGAAGVSAIPVLLVRGLWVWACAVCLLCGVSQGALWGAFGALLEAWLPGQTWTADTVFCNLQLGVSVGLWLCGYVGSLWVGGRGVCVAAGGAGAAGAVCVALLTADSPQTHPAAGDTEKQFVDDLIREVRSKPSPRLLSWRRLLTSRALYGAALSRCALCAVATIALTHGPIYLIVTGSTVQQSMWALCVGAASALCVGVVGQWGARWGKWGVNCSQMMYGLGCVLMLSLLVALSRCPTGGRARCLLACLVASHGATLPHVLESLHMTFRASAGRALLATSVAGALLAAAAAAAAGIVLGEHVLCLSRWRIIFLSLSFLHGIGHLCHTVIMPSRPLSADDASAGDPGIHYKITADTGLLALHEFTPRDLTDTAHTERRKIEAL